MTLLGAVLTKLLMAFVADLWQTLAALATVAVCAIGLRMHGLSPVAAAMLMPAGVLAALTLGVLRGAGPKP